MTEEAEDIMMLIDKVGFIRY